jgi:hypothetical protein
MKVKLIYEYRVKDTDGVGTANDAVIVAIRQLLTDYEKADSTDDVVGIFDNVVIE